MPPAERRRRKITSLMTVAVTAVVVAFAVSLVWAVVIDTEPEPFTALTFADQTVVTISPEGVATVPVVSGFEPPAVLLGDNVPVEGERCIAVGVDPPLAVSANVWWERVEPEGLRIPTLVDFKTSITEPECVGLVFSNAMPEEVVAAVEADGRVSERWRITGAVQPERAGARVAIWRTEPFTIVNSVDVETEVPGG